MSAGLPREAGPRGSLVHPRPYGDKVVRASRLAGCDGRHSTVRKLLGIGFEGTGPTLTGRQATVKPAGLGAPLLGLTARPPPGRP
ncbi:FAD-dependent monooxygenase [Streptomyces sp. URMC 126]|uniref:FAD-dependent monooxygenase n=1 Tax=Streptomyces sp. URMC 126 TaxID=3423401 RepID=UPI003F1D4982